MSVLIKGMKMPTGCAACHLRNQEFHKGDKYLYGCSLCRDWGTDQTRADDCPLVEVPTPHGDLIDREKVKELLLDLWKDGENYTIADIIREIVDIPAIIESEE